MKKITLLPVLIIILLIFGCTATVNQTPEKIKNTGNNQSTQTTLTGRVNYTYYSAPNFLLYYPKGWKVAQSKNGIFEFDSPLEDQNDQIKDGFVVEIWKGNQSTPEEFENYEKTLFSQGDKIISRKSASYKNRDTYALEVEGINKETGVMMYYKTLFFRNGPWVYRLSYAIEKSKMNKYQQVMEEMLDKFVIGDYGI